MKPLMRAESVGSLREAPLRMGLHSRASLDAGIFPRPAPHTADTRTLRMSTLPRVPRNLREHLVLLRQHGELAEVRCEVSSDLEAAEIHRRVIAAGGPALLFTNVRGKAFPLATNLFGTKRRVDLAFGERGPEVIAEVAKLPEELMPPSLGKLWGKRKLFTSLAKVGMKRKGAGAVAEVVVRDPDLDQLPALKTWSRDGGPFLTLPLVYTEDPESGVGNLGMYRIQCYGGADVGVHIQIHRGAGNHLHIAEQRGEALPVAIHLGGPPALILAAIAPLPENVPELLLASLMLGERLALGTSGASPYPYVADSDFVLCGSIQPGARRPEGPFGDHYGYYSEVHDFPWMKVDTLLHKRDAVFPATVVGKPRQEDFFLGDYLQELLSPLFPLVMPGVKRLWSYGETGYHSLSAAVVRERYKREAMTSAFRILGEGQLSLTKFLLVTDGDVDLADFRSVLAHILERTDPRTDLFLLCNLSMDTLDYAGPEINEGSKGVLLGMGEPIRKCRETFDGAPASGVTDVRVFCPGCLVLQGPAFDADPEAAARIVRDPAFADWPFLVLTDDAERATRSPQNFLWTTFTRFDPATDVHASRAEPLRGHLAHHPPILIDARMKPSYPEELFCDPATADLVDKRWSEYFPNGGVEMGDSDRGHLD